MKFIVVGGENYTNKTQLLVFVRCIISSQQLWKININGKGCEIDSKWKCGSESVNVTKHEDTGIIKIPQYMKLTSHPEIQEGIETNEMYITLSQEIYRFLFDECEFLSLKY
jgi:hypothetical protein